MAPTTRRNFLALNYFLLATNTVLSIASVATTCPAGQILAWASNARGSDRIYGLKDDVVSPEYSPRFKYIKEWSIDVDMVGTCLILVVGILATLTAVGTIIYVLVNSLKPLMTSTIPTNTKRSNALLLVLATITTILALTAFITSWQAYYNAPNLRFSSSSINSRGEYNFWPKQTPESWLRGLLAAVTGDNHTELYEAYLIAATARIIICPIFVLELVSFTASLMLRERMKPGVGSFMHIAGSDEGLDLEDGTPKVGIVEVQHGVADEVALQHRVEEAKEYMPTSVANGAGRKISLFSMSVK